MRASCPHMPIMKYMGISVSFPEDEEEEEIERDEDADHGRFRLRAATTKKPFTFSWIDSQEQRIAERREERGEEDEKQADAVDAEVVVDGRRRSTCDIPNW